MKWVRHAMPNPSGERDAQTMRAPADIDFPPIVTTGHVITGLKMIDADGVAVDDVFFTCEQLDHLSPEMLRELDESAYPSLNSCGRHNLRGH